MSIINERKALIAAASAISAMGLFVAQVPAQAAPMLPLAPACNDYAFPNLLQVSQDNGITVQIPTSGKTVGPGRAMYAIVGKTSGTFGNAYGGINGRKIDFTVSWDEGPGAGFTNTYSGQVGNDGFASGTTRNNQNTSNGWRSSEKFTCADAPAPAPAQPAPPAQEQRPPVTQGARTATVTEDVDVYERPNLNNDLESLGFLSSGDQVELVGDCQPDDWCQVKGPTVPNGHGFIWGHLQLP
jgi:hypothetical protein